MLQIHFAQANRNELIHLFTYLPLAFFCYSCNNVSVVRAYGNKDPYPKFKPLGKERDTH